MKFERPQLFFAQLAPLIAGIRDAFARETSAVKSNTVVLSGDAGAPVVSPGVEPHLAATGHPSQVWSIDPARSVRLAPTQRDRNFWIALVFVTFIYAMLLAVAVGMGWADSDNFRRGTEESSDPLTVELVEAPDKDSKSKVSQQGQEAPPQPPQDKPPEPPQPQVEAQPVEQPVEKPVEKQPPPEEPKREAKQKPSKPPDPTPSLDGFDLSLDDYAAAVDAQMAERRKQREARRATPPNSDLARILGAAPSGMTSPYAKSVIAALSKTKPTIALTKGEVFVAFQLTPAGELRFIRILKSSNDALVDELAVNAIKKAKYPVPGPNADPRDLTYVIHYVFD